MMLLFEINSSFDIDRTKKLSAFVIGASHDNHGAIGFVLTVSEI